MRPGEQSAQEDWVPRGADYSKEQSAHAVNAHFV